MTPNEFWNEEPELLESYKKAYEIKQQVIDSEEWKLGVYFNKALNANLYNMFKKKGSPSQYYYEKPLLADSTKSEEEIEQERVKMREEKIKERLKKGKRILDEEKNIGQTKRTNYRQRLR